MTGPHPSLHPSLLTQIRHEIPALLRLAVPIIMGELPALGATGSGVSTTLARCYMLCVLLAYVAWRNRREQWRLGLYGRHLHRARIAMMLGCAWALDWPEHRTDRHRLCTCRGVVSSRAAVAARARQRTGRPAGANALSQPAICLLSSVWDSRARAISQKVKHALNANSVMRGSIA